MDAQMIKTLQDYFATQPVLKAWVFGSFARGEETEESDVDLLEEFDRRKKPARRLGFAIPTNGIPTDARAERSETPASWRKCQSMPNGASASWQKRQSMPNGISANWRKR